MYARLFLPTNTSVTQAKGKVDVEGNDAVRGISECDTEEEEEEEGGENAEVGEEEEEKGGGDEREEEAEEELEDSGRASLSCTGTQYSPAPRPSMSSV